MNKVYRPDTPCGTLWHAEQWVLEFKPEGGGRFGRLRDPVLSPTGRLRIVAEGLLARSGHWFHYVQPTACAVPVRGARLLTAAEIAHVTGGITHVSEH